ncbi:MAG: M20/M25/M40 family metallo-hydrolase [Chloroflexota bacterium]
MMDIEKTEEIVDLAKILIRFPSVTVGESERMDAVNQAAAFIELYFRQHGLDVRLFDDAKFPALLVGFPGQLLAPVMLSGHFDVVAPEPDDGQFEPRIEGDYLWGRGAGDMKTVVATYMVWMKYRLLAGPPYPPINLLLVGNEEAGEGEPMGTPHVLDTLASESGYSPNIFIAGERTETSGKGLCGEVAVQNRGVMRFDLIAHGQRGHTGVAGAQRDLSARLMKAYADVQEMMARYLTLEAGDGWCSQVRFPFIKVGTPGIYNINADHGVLGVEARLIPQDDVESLYHDLAAYCSAHDFALENLLMEKGIACDPENPYLKALTAAVESISGEPAQIGRKLPGTSARFAPGGQGVVWGQSGLGPHASDERHYIPSIWPYYQSLNAFGEILLQMDSDG